MKKSYLNRITLGLLFAGAMLLISFPQAGSAAPPAAPAAGEGHLTITRSPKLGTGTTVMIMVDGKKVGTVSSGNRFNSSIPAGRHTLTVRFEPITNAEKPANLTFDVAAGQTYSYVATIQHGDIALQKNR